MLEQDYLMRQILLLIDAMIASQRKKDEELDPAAAADSLEDAITTAIDLDGVALLSLAPESIADVMRVSGIDPGMVGYIAHSILLESVYLREAGNDSLATLREGQARSLALSYDLELPDDPTDFDALSARAHEAQAALWEDGLAGNADDMLDIDAIIQQERLL